MCKHISGQDKQGFEKAQVQINAENNQAGNYVPATTLTSRLANISSNSWNTLADGQWQMSDSTAMLTRLVINNPDAHLLWLTLWPPSLIQKALR